MSNSSDDQSVNAVNDFLASISADSFFIGSAFAAIDDTAKKAIVLRRRQRFMAPGIVFAGSVSHLWKLKKSLPVELLSQVSKKIKELESNPQQFSDRKKLDEVLPFLLIHYLQKVASLPMNYANWQDQMKLIREVQYWGTVLENNFPKMHTYFERLRIENIPPFYQSQIDEIKKIRMTTVATFGAVTIGLALSGLSLIAAAGGVLALTGTEAALVLTARAVALLGATLGTQMSAMQFVITLFDATDGKLDSGEAFQSNGWSTLQVIFEVSGIATGFVEFLARGAALKALAREEVTRQLRESIKSRGIAALADIKDQETKKALTRLFRQYLKDNEQRLEPVVRKAIRDGKFEKYVVSKRLIESQLKWLQNRISVIARSEVRRSLGLYLAKMFVGEKADRLSALMPQLLISAMPGQIVGSASGGVNALFTGKFINEYFDARVQYIPRQVMIDQSW
jgi:hypothetical protein